jgi:predicted nucleotidyltransferase component of viral defense system
MQSYMMERLLERISLSQYRRNFILKGGFLIAAILGLDARATMDLDTTIKGFPLIRDSIRKVFDEVCAVAVDDGITFSVARVSDIREGDEYPGLRVAITASYPPIAVPLTVDVTTGDIITPSEVEFSFGLMFENRSISVLAYTLETILAEKLETVLSRNIANTRPRDFYDIHVLWAMRGDDCNMAALKQALDGICLKRGSLSALAGFRQIVERVQADPQMIGFWEKYRKEYGYARDIAFKDACGTVLKILLAMYGV